MNTSLPISDVPAWVLVVGGVLVVAQLGFEVFALVHMLRRPADQLTLGGRKWLWAIIILFVNWIGAILYFVAGRKPAAAVEVAAATPIADRAAVAADSLYGGPPRSAGAPPADVVSGDEQ
ncbi:MAG TPA: PLD nuclease N-terminal domain-containing protein [Coriobacteriia bacterium]